MVHGAVAAVATWDCIDIVSVNRSVYRPLCRTRLFSLHKLKDETPAEQSAAARGLTIP